MLVILLRQFHLLYWVSDLRTLAVFDVWKSSNGLCVRLRGDKDNHVSISSTIAKPMKHQTEFLYKLLTRII